MASGDTLRDTPIVLDANGHFVLAYGTSCVGTVEQDQDEAEYTLWLFNTTSTNCLSGSSAGVVAATFDLCFCTGEQINSV